MSRSTHPVPKSPGHKLIVPAASAACSLLAGCEANTAPAPKSRAPGAGAARRLRERERQRANSSAWCARATRPISASASPARSSPASSMSATACAPATSWRGSIRRTSSCRSKAPRPSLPPRPPISPRRRPISSATRRCSTRGYRLGRRLRPQEGGEGRSRRPARARQARARSRAQPARLCRPQGRRRRRHHGDAGRARPGRRDRPGGGAARPSRREGSRGRAARDLARRGAQVERDGAAVVGPRPQLRGAAARALAAGRCRDPHLCGALHHHGRGRRGRVRHDRDRRARARWPTRRSRGCRSPRSSTAAAARSVYVVDDTGALVLRPVTVASFTEDAALVTSGISDGDQVVTLGVQKLEAGPEGPHGRDPLDANSRSERS